MQVIVNDILINYQVIESKKDFNILFIHGWADNIKGQKDFIHKLSSLGNVYALDLPGFGDSQAPERDLTILDFAKYVNEFCRKIKLDKINLLIGHSNGGAIAIKGLMSHEIKADKLILLAASGVRDAYKSKVSLLRVISKTGKALSSPLPSEMKYKLRKKLYKSVGSDMLIAEHMQGTFKNIVAEDLQNDASQLDLPTLLIYGENDDMTPPKYGLMYHELIKGSIIEIVGQAGHFVQRDQPEITLNLIKDFIK